MDPVSTDLVRLLAARARGAGRSDLAALFALAERSDVISFAGGFPDPEWFLPELGEVAERILRDSPGPALQYGPTPGLTAFREFVAERCTGQGVQADVDNILITSGSLQGLDLVCKVFLDPGDVVVLEDPTYLGAIQTISSYQATMVGVPGDQHGLSIEALDETIAELRRDGRRPKFIYTVPSFQNPTGLTLPLERRRALLEVAARHGLPVVEDHAYAELHYDGEPLPSLKALTNAKPVVIQLGTFSKIFSPGLRLGWAVAPPEIIEKLNLFKQGTDQCSNTLGQLMALEYGKRGLIERQIAVTRSALRGKRDLVLAALGRHFGDAARYTIPEGGFYTWLTLSERAADTRASLSRAVAEHRVGYVPGPAFYAGSGGVDQLRLCFSLVPADLIDEGVARLRRATGDGRGSGGGGGARAQGPGAGD